MYHIFNRSIGKEDVFSSKLGLRRVFKILDYYRFPQKIRLSKFRDLPKDSKDDYFRKFRKLIPLVEIYAYSFMPNHYHLLIKQLQENGIVRLISNFQNSFAKVFNLKNKRHGGLFQNSFKAKRLETEEEFLHVSRYIMLNPVTSYLIEFNNLANNLRSSYCCYLDKEKNMFVNTKFLLGRFNSKKSFIRFISNQIDYQRKLSLIKKLIIENPGVRI